MSIKVWDYVEEYAEEREEILKAVDQVFKSGVLILGDRVKQFESDFAAYCGVKYGVGVDNATNGIFLALQALGVGVGDEVITVANTAVPTVSAIVQAGATPRFVDIDPRTYLMDVTQVERAITPRTKCLVPVHLYGQCVDMAALGSLASKHGLSIIEDSSQAHGATLSGRRAGSMSDMGVFSFYPTKPLGGYGDGGIVVTNSADLEGKLRRLRFYGMKGVYYAEEKGYNCRLDEVQAAILSRKLKRLDGYLSRRRHLAKRYEGILGSTSLVLPATRPECEHAFYVYVVRHSDRERIMASLKEKEIHLNISYPWPIHTMRAFLSFGGREGDLPNTEAASKAIFSLPMYPSLGEEKQDDVCRELGAVLGENVSV